ncbi:MAG: hypothetical protein K940chlam3_01481 [Chlamydiae bacterium]|nr:hypothetical protein [Chlamydiota bacterium]
MDMSVSPFLEVNEDIFFQISKNLHVVDVRTLSAVCRSFHVLISLSPRHCYGDTESNRQFLAQKLFSLTADTLAETKTKAAQQMKDALSQQSEMFRSEELFQNVDKLINETSDDLQVQIRNVFETEFSVYELVKTLEFQMSEVGKKQIAMVSKIAELTEHWLKSFVSEKVPRMLMEYATTHLFNMS